MANTAPNNATADLLITQLIFVTMVELIPLQFGMTYFMAKISIPGQVPDKAIVMKFLIIYYFCLKEINRTLKNTME